MKNVEPKVLESHAEWRAADVADPESWTLHLDDHDHAELDAALALAKQTSADPLEIRREDFPLERLGDKLESTLNMLANGRGFTRISALDADATARTTSRSSSGASGCTSARRVCRTSTATSWAT